MAALIRADAAKAESNGDATPEVVAAMKQAGLYWMLVPEEQLTHITTIPGQTHKQLIRADMTYIEKPRGGAVFSVGSITYCGSLPHDKFDNDVSRLTFNVLNRFGELGLKWPF